MPGIMSPFVTALGGQLSMFHAVSVWYALLYVVVEGYRELDLHDKAVDSVLSEGNYVEELRRFRNAIFHYQEQVISPKIMEFLEAKDSEIWIRRLNRALDRFLTNALGIKEDLERWKLIDPSVSLLPE